MTCWARASSAGQIRAEQPPLRNQSCTFELQSCIMNECRGPAPQSSASPGGWHCTAPRCADLGLLLLPAAVQVTGKTGSSARSRRDGQLQDRGLLAAVPRTGTFQSFKQPLLQPVQPPPHQPLLTSQPASQPAAFSSCLLQLAVHIYYVALAMQKTTCKRRMTWEERDRG